MAHVCWNGTLVDSIDRTVKDTKTEHSSLG